MKITPIHAVLILLAGLGLNVAVACLIAGTERPIFMDWMHGFVRGGRSDRIANPAWPEPALAGWPAPVADKHFANGIMTIDQAWGGVVTYWERPPLKAATLGMARVEIGYPFRVFVRSSAFDMRTNPRAAWTPKETSAWQNGVVLPWSFAPGEPARLPVRPLALGMVLNTLFYSAVIFGAIFAVKAWRAKRWAWAGRCRGSGYDLSGTRSERAIRCPECGKPI